jgi:hypothetical protein
MTLWLKGNKKEKDKRTSLQELLGQWRLKAGQRPQSMIDHGPVPVFSIFFPVWTDFVASSLSHEM